MRLSPIYPNWYLNVLGYAHYLLGQYDEAEGVLKQALERDPAYGDSRCILAACHQARGRIEEARRELERLRRHSPGFGLHDMEAQLAIEKDQAAVARFLEALRSLGLE